MKTTKEMAEVMLAFDRGEQIEFMDCSQKWKDVNNPIWDWVHCDYRVKPKKKFVPFDTAEEFLEAQREHGEVIVDKMSGEKSNAYVNKNGTVVSTKILSNVWTIGCLGTVFSYYKFEDGTPCGKEVEVCQI